MTISEGCFLLAALLFLILSLSLIGCGQWKVELNPPVTVNNDFYDEV